MGWVCLQLVSVVGGCHWFCGGFDCCVRCYSWLLGLLIWLCFGVSVVCFGGCLQLLLIALRCCCIGN